MEMAEDQELISELPEMLRLHILSALPRKDAIRTGVLSSLWKGLWKYRLSLTDTSLDFGRSFSEGKSDEETVQEIAEAMQRRGKNLIEVFNLCVHPSADKDTVSAWIQQASASGAEEASLDFSGKGGPIVIESLNAEVFAVNSLVLLSLSNCKLEGDFNSTTFNSLDRLYFEKVVTNDSVMRELVGNCPVLTRLELRECSGLHDMVFKFPTLHLKTLVVFNCWKLRTIDVCSPALVSVDFYGQTACLFVIRDVTSLVDASMVAEVRGQSIKFLNSRAEAGQKFVNALAMSSNRLEEMLRSNSSPFGDVEYLSGLQLVVLNNGWLAPLYQYLGQQNFRYLEKMFIELPPNYEDATMDFYRGIEMGLPTVSVRRLRAVKLNNFRGRENEMLLLRFLLGTATALRMMIVVFPHDIDDTQKCTQMKDTINKEIARMPKASQALEIMVCCTFQYTNTWNLSQSIIASDWSEATNTFRNLRLVSLALQPSTS
ncbi:hypothetical protein J5N97_027155 [Dioscorea zingiberensis]|uniref:At1g61320/AtMIF1 LRR domain-containing protein n=1 Tax=Dioscorea zingiberensis TaxID=325984 RepID=A0A9D5H7I0_9LILI|nr:hypothetical protein J5N97_027155 [Dioscorea zingiberensis]